MSIIRLNVRRVIKTLCHLKQPYISHVHNVERQLYGDVRNAENSLENMCVNHVDLEVHRCFIMAKMGLMYKINPEKPGDQYANELVEKIRDVAKKLGGELKDYKLEPLAFGLYTLTVLVAVDEEKESFPDEFEATIKKLDGVSSIENVGMTRL